VELEETFITRQRLSKHVPDATNTQAKEEVLLEKMFPILSVQSGYKRAADLEVAHPCGGGVEYLHRDPASRRRRRKGKSQI
jgi:hypothetical protein